MATGLSGYRFGGRDYRIGPVDPLSRDGTPWGARRKSSTDTCMAIFHSLRPAAALFFSSDDRPTCAARRSLLIGGTASVVGEDSRHPRNLDAQLEETLLNMEALVRTARPDDGDSALRSIVSSIFASTLLSLHTPNPSQSASTRRCPQRAHTRSRRRPQSAAEICLWKLRGSQSFSRRVSGYPSPP